MHRSIPLACLFLLLPSTVGLAQTPTVPIGDEFRVNTYTTNDQFFANVAVGPNGDFVVVWMSDGAADDTDDRSVQGQRFGSGGDPIGDQFQVNTYTTGFQGIGDVALDADGDFVVVFSSVGSDGGSDPDLGVHGQRFASDGNPLGAPFEVNTYTTSDQVVSSIAMHADGRFVVAWASYGDATDTDRWSVHARRYAANGDPAGAGFLVNTYTTGEQLGPSVAMDGDGDFVVVWASSRADNGDDLDPSIQGQRYASNGDLVGSQFRVNTYTTSPQEQAEIAMDAAGNFLVAWKSEAADQDASGDSVHGRLYGSDGNPRGAQFQINTSILGDQDLPAVGVDGVGDFVIAWTSQISPGDDSSNRSIQARRLTSDGVFVGDQFQVNSLTTFAQDWSAVAVTSEGDFVVVWESDVSDTEPDQGIRGQRFRVTADLGDRVFLDADFDGLQGAGEIGIPGIPVHLFEQSGGLVASTSTDADGLFAFQPKIGLAGVTDRFYLQFDAPMRYSISPAKVGSDDTIDSDADPTLGQTANYAITAAGEILLDIDAGMTNGIGNRVWHDIDGNGIQNGGEPGRDGVTVELYDDSDMLLDTTVTAAGGQYGFADLDAGTYYLTFVAPAGFAFTAPDRGFDDAADSDATASGETALISFGDGDIRSDLDAGLEPAVIGDRVWLDQDGDGLQLPSDIGLSGITVRLLNESDVEVDSAVTDGDGGYGFAGIASGNYRIEVVLPTDGVFSPQDEGADDLVDSDVDSAGRTALFAYTAGSASRGLDAGLRLVPLFADGFESGNTTAWSNAVP